MDRIGRLSHHLSPQPTSASSASASSASATASSLRLRPNALREALKRPSTFDVAAVQAFLDDDNLPLRAELRDFLCSDALFTPVYDMTVDEKRTLALQRLQKLCERPGRVSVARSEVGNLNASLWPLVRSAQPASVSQEQEQEH